MKRNQILLSGTLLVCALVIGLWRGCRQAPDPALNPANDSRSSNRAGSAAHAPDPTSVEDHAAHVRSQCVEFAKEKNLPIEYYGRVVDQDHKPLQGVKVGFTVTAIPKTPVPWGPDETTKGSCETDANGLFSVSGSRGVSFGVNRIEKPGYRESGYFNQGHVRYESNNPQGHVPDPSKPVEFMLIRDDLPKAEKVFNERVRWTWNSGTSTKSIGPEVGTIVFYPRRNGLDPTNRQLKFDWSVTMRFEGFSVVRLPGGDQARVAPLDGYEATAACGQGHDEEKWSSSFEGVYAIRTTDGKFGAMKISVFGDGDDDGMCGRVTIYLNKSGARNIDHN